MYGSLEELERFTDAVVRWDVSAVEQLPDYMKLCYMALLNTNNEIGYMILKEQGFDITSHQKKAWLGLCKAYFTEAKWFYQGYKPTVKEYFDNAVYSIAAPLMLTNCYFLTTEKITKEALECIECLPPLIHSSAMILRLADDLGTSDDELKRGDAPKSIQCYMNEMGISEEAAREQITGLMSQVWKKMNKAWAAQYPFSEPFLDAPANLGRTAQCVYLHGDGHGDPKVNLDNLISLVVESVSL